MGGQQPDDVDEETAAHMRKLADLFISNAATEGWHFSWDAAEAPQLDELCDAFMASKPSSEIQLSVGMAIGAYLGEMMVRCGGGRWGYDPEQRAAFVEMPELELKAYPHNKVFKRFDMGSEHSLAVFLMYGLTREVPQGTKVAEVSDPPARH